MNACSYKKSLSPLLTSVKEVYAGNPNKALEPSICIPEHAKYKCRKNKNFLERAESTPGFPGLAGASTVSVPGLGISTKLGSVTQVSEGFGVRKL